MLSPNLPAPMLLAIAIAIEVFASTCLAKSDGFTQLLPTLASLVGYAVSFYCLSQVVKSMPLGIVYAIWSGVGIVLTALIGWLWLGNRLDMPAIVGMALIIAGVMVINLWSKAGS